MALKTSCLLTRCSRLLFIFIMAVSVTSASAQNRYRYQLAVTIDSLAAEAQQWSSKLRHYMAAQLGDTALKSSLLRGQTQCGRGTRATIRLLLVNENYPGVREVGEATSEHFWQLLQQADEDPLLQKEALLLMKPQVDSGNVPGSHYAFLADRVLVNGGNQQLYGTQLKLSSDSTRYELRPVQDPSHLDQRRALLGLPPMAEYLDLINRRYRQQLRIKE